MTADSTHQIDSSEEAQADGLPLVDTSSGTAVLPVEGEGVQYGINTTAGVYDDDQTSGEEIDQSHRLGLRKKEKLSKQEREIRDRNVRLWGITDELAFDEEVDRWITEIRNGDQDGNPGLHALRGDADNKPHVSIVIPAHNEERYILQVLQAIAAQKYDRGVEVIVVDNNSDPSDRTASFAEQCGARVISYSVTDGDPENDLAQIALARQRGLEAATGDIIISTDADVITPEAWIEAITTPLDQEPDTKVVTGDIKYYDMPRILAGQNWARTVGRKALTFYSNKNMFRGLGKSSGNGANSAFRRTEAIKLGGFDTSLYPGEDTDLAHRLTEDGTIKFVTEKSARVHVSPRRYDGIGAANTARVLLNYTTAYNGDEGPKNRR